MDDTPTDPLPNDPPEEPAAAAEQPTDGAEQPGAEQPAGATGKPSGAKTTRERAEAKRQERLDHVREQQENGSLVIRPMTEEERLRYPVRPRPPQRTKR